MIWAMPARAKTDDYDECRSIWQDGVLLGFVYRPRGQSHWLTSSPEGDEWPAARTRGDAVATVAEIATESMLTDPDRVV